MKKKVFATLLLAGMVLGTGQAVFAAEPVTPPEGYEIIDNGDGEQYDPAKGADIPVNGTLGNLDNTNPDENIPEGDSRWIKVELPTEVLFNTIGDKNETVDSIDYHVTNLSGRPVNVSLGNFAPVKDKTSEALLTLNLQPTKDTKPNGTAIPLLSSPKDKFLTKLETPTKSTENTYTFKYTGTTDSDKLKAKDRITVEYNMNLKFEVLKADGTPAK